MICSDMLTGVVQMRLAHKTVLKLGISESPVSSTHCRPSDDSFCCQSAARSLHNAFMGATVTYNTQL